MPSTLNRLATLTAGAVLAVVAGGLTSVSSASAGAGTVTPAAPVGTWVGTVQHAGGGGAVTLTFRTGGLACLVSSDGGGVGGDGVGLWHSTGTEQFSYRILERLHDGNGATTGFVDVNQDAVLSTDAFTSSGTSRIYDPYGTYITSAVATVAVVRSLSTPPVC